MKPAILAFALGLLLAPGRDIDVAVPPGTPLEWDKDLHQPVPTGGRARVPTTDKAPEFKAPVPGSKTPQQGRTISAKDVPLDYGITNLYQYFGITTRDISNHIKVTCPGGGLVKDGDVATGGGSGVNWVYPPEHPVELVWIGVAGCLRAILHPELVSVPETVAYLCEVGEPTIVFARQNNKDIDGPVGVKLKALVTGIPKELPAVKAGATPLETMIYRLAVFELTSGFPHALDPTYARRTLSLGEDSYKAVLEASKSPHPFLARNASAVLVNYRNADVLKELRRLLGAQDAVIRYRALTALARRKDAEIVPVLVKNLTSADDVFRAACAYALGQIGDPKAIDPLMRVAGGADIDYLWSILPAVARLAGPKKEVEDFFKAMEARVKASKSPEAPAPPNPQLVPPKPEPAGTKIQVLLEMCRLGLAACGDDMARRELRVKFDDKGANGFLVPNQVLLCNVLGKLNDGKDALKKIVEAAPSDRVAAQALMDLQHLAAETDWLQRMAETHRMPGVRALALAELFERGEAFFVPTAKRIIEGGMGFSDGGGAYVLGTALQLMAKTANGIDVAALIRIVTEAHKAGVWARREGENDPDITKANIKITPPLLEIACIELGRKADPKGLPALLAVLRSEAGGGRAEAALALGAIGGTEAVEALLSALDDPKDGWLRFCAYQSLKKLSGRDHFCDWIFGGAAARRSALASYKQWAGKP